MFIKIAITLIICTLIGFYFWNNEKSGENKIVNRQTVTNTVNASARASSTSVVRNTPEHDNIDKTLQIVAEKLSQNIDVNGDGKTNCIDAAIIFYKYYPDKSKVCIEINKNPKTGMHHLFNCVFTDGAWKAIEPQAYYTDHSNYFMWAVWGDKYDNKYNRDETETWKVYAK